jgi:hypothetical protein
MDWMIRGKLDLSKIHREILTIRLVFGGISINAIIGDASDALMLKFTSRWVLVGSMGRRVPGMTLYMRSWYADLF